ncbi:MAG TPA: HDIG domain-containing protein [Rhabdochlamydiaceae bacterium]|nr:HDIG domain-containing protein [Rhabdochlamydiaceae bacterium]
MYIGTGAPTKISWKNWLGEGHFGKRLLLAFIFFVALSFFLHFRQVRMEMLDLNSIAEHYLIAQVDFEFPDEQATFILKQQSLRDIGKIFRLDEKQVSQTRFDFESYLLTHQEWRDQLEHSTFEEMYKGADALEEALLQVRFTNSRTLQKIKDYQVSRLDNFSLTPPNPEQFLVLPDDFWAKVSQKIFHSKYQVEASQFILNAFQKRLWQMKEDLPGERSLRQIVQDSIPHQYTQVKAGTHIIDPGERVTTRHLAMLQAMKEAISKERDLWAPRTIIGSILLSLLLSVLSIVYFRINHREMLNSLQKITLLVTIVILTLLLSKGAEYLLVDRVTYLTDIFRYPILIPFASILIYVLVGAENALFASAFLTIILGVTLALDHSRFLIINLIASWVTILFAKKLHKRKEVFSVLAKVWLVSVPVIFALNFAQNLFSPIHLMQDLASSFIFISFIALLIVGLLPLLESLFHVMTDMTLMEYMDPNNELLRRMSTEAPGTYQHSLVVGNLAENAARAIGANGLLCRVATLYHDIGKLFNPQYFTENQMAAFNIHQLLTPLESTQVIVAHIPEGEALAKKHRLPQCFIDIISQHHGTTLVYYFYRKQMTIAGEKEKIEEKLFRYPGPKPHTRESALIMLSDSIEAASRCLEEINEKTLTELVDNLVAEKLEDGQLDECQLTFEELGLAKKSFVRTLSVTGHLRVKYPEKAQEERKCRQPMLY